MSMQWSYLISLHDTGTWYFIDFYFKMIAQKDSFLASPLRIEKHSWKYSKGVSLVASL